MKRIVTARGFTLTEIMVVVALVALIAGFGVVALRQLFDASVLEATSSEVYEALVSARTRTLAAENNAVFGVHVSTTTVTRFEGAMYVAGNASNKTYTFPNTVFATGTLAVSGATIVFEHLTGKPSATGNILLVEADGSSTTTIGIYASGLIQYEE